jgi:hypothetical protein
MCNLPAVMPDGCYWYIHIQLEVLDILSFVEKNSVVIFFKKGGKVSHTLVLLPGSFWLESFTCRKQVIIGVVYSPES